MCSVNLFYVKVSNCIFSNEFQGAELANRIKAVKYVECSAKTHQGIKEVFDQAILTTLLPPKKAGLTRKSCTITWCAANIYTDTIGVPF